MGKVSVKSVSAVDGLLGGRHASLFASGTRSSFSAFCGFDALHRLDGGACGGAASFELPRAHTLPKQLSSTHVDLPNCVFLGVTILTALCQRAAGQTVPAAMPSRNCCNVFFAACLAADSNSSRLSRVTHRCTTCTITSTLLLLSVDIILSYVHIGNLH